VVGEQLAALIGLSVGVVIGVSTSIIAARHEKLAIPPIPALITVLSAVMAVEGLAEGGLTKFSVGVALAFCIYPLIWRASSTALKIAYSVLLIAISVLFIATVGVGAIFRLAGTLALIGMAAGIANIVMLAKR